MPPVPTPPTEIAVAPVQAGKKFWPVYLFVCLVFLVAAGAVFVESPALRAFIFEKVVSIKDDVSLRGYDTSTPVTTTTATTTPDGNEISISLTIPSVIKKKNGMQIRWSLSGVPAGSSIGFFLDRNLPREDANLLPGVTGALALTAENVSGTKSGTFDWDGVSVGCAPTDYPTYCQGVEPGEYVIKTVIYNEDHAPLVMGFPPPNYKGPSILADAESAPFTVRGSYNLGPLKSNLTGAVVNKVQKSLAAYAFAGTHMEQYVQMRGDVAGPDASGMYCATFDLLGPVKGPLIACGPNKYGPDLITVSGEVQVVDGVLPYADAVKAAHTVADQPYKSRVKFDHQASMQEAGYTGEGYTDYLQGFYEWSKAHPDADTYLSTGVTNWVYRTDGNYWLFIISEIKAGGQESGPDRFADNVLVRVENSGVACVVKTAGYSQSLDVNIFTDAVRCK